MILSDLKYRTTIQFNTQQYSTIMLKQGSVDRHNEDAYSIQDLIDRMQMKTIQSSIGFPFMIKVTRIGTFAILYVFGFVHAAQGQGIIKNLFFILYFTKKPRSFRSYKCCFIGIWNLNLR